MYYRYKSVFLSVFLATTPMVAAAVNVDLGTAGTYGVLSSTFTCTIGTSVITGDAGYATTSGSHTFVSGGDYIAPADSQAGTDQGTALTWLAGQACTEPLSGGVDLAANASHLTGIYTPGVYCIDGAMNIAGGATVTLNGNGLYIFRSTGALGTTDNSKVVLTGGAQAGDVFWTPLATTLGANNTFVGTVIDTAAITAGHLTSWTGRALAYGKTVTFDTVTITAPVAPVLSVLVGGTYDFGKVDIGSTNDSTAAVTVQNDGSGITETYKIKLTNPATWSAVTGAPTLIEQYRLQAQFSAVAPLTGSWTPATMALTTGDLTAAVSPGNLAGLGQDGYQTAHDESNNLWFRFEAPVLTTVDTPQTINITITAITP
jgi:hypothetical protein